MDAHEQRPSIPIRAVADRLLPRRRGRTALYNWALAKRLGGTFVLRIEDTDEARNRPEWTQGIIDALAWIGINADDPTFEGPYFQSALRRRAPRRRRAAVRGRRTRTTAT